MNKKFMTPLDEQVAKIVESRTKFSLMVTFNELVQSLTETDKKIENIPEGEEKECLLRAQQEAWELLLSDQLCKIIIIEV